MADIATTAAFAAIMSLAEPTNPIAPIEKTQPTIIASDISSARDITLPSSTLKPITRSEIKLSRLVAPPQFLVDRFRLYENSVKAGRDNTTGNWTPHKSVEGGTPTLAYGHKLNKEEISSGTVTINGEVIDLQAGITDEQADELLRQDILEHMLLAQKTVSNFNDLDPLRQAVVTDLAFNLGANKLKAFKKGTLALIEAGEFEKAANSLSKNKRFAKDRLEANVKDLRNGIFDVVKPEPRPKI